MPRRPLPFIPARCRKCGEPSGKFKHCPLCRAKNREALARFYGRPVSGPSVCQTEGCNEEIPPRAKFCRACSKDRKTARNRSRGKVSDGVPVLKPHRATVPSQRKPSMSEEEQTRLRAKASAEDRAWHARFMKACLGLESTPGQPLASKVTRPPKEVWKQYEEAYRPLRNQEKEFHIPLRADIAYN